MAEEWIRLQRVKSHQCPSYHLHQEQIKVKWEVQKLLRPQNRTNAAVQPKASGNIKEKKIGNTGPKAWLRHPEVNCTESKKACFVNVPKKDLQTKVIIKNTRLQKGQL